MFFKTFLRTILETQFLENKIKQAQSSSCYRSRKSHSLGPAYAVSSRYSRFCDQLIPLRLYHVPTKKKKKNVSCSEKLSTG